MLASLFGSICIHVHEARVHSRTITTQRAAAVCALMVVLAEQLLDILKVRTVA